MPLLAPSRASSAGGSRKFSCASSETGLFLLMSGMPLWLVADFFSNLPLNQLRRFFSTPTKHYFWQYLGARCATVSSFGFVCGKRPFSKRCLESALKGRKAMRLSQSMINNPVPWPNDARCACCITFDMDADSLIHLEHPEDGYRRASAISSHQYGPNIAVPRIVETYRILGIRQTFYIPGWCMERYPHAV